MAKKKTRKKRSDDDSPLKNSRLSEIDGGEAEGSEGSLFDMLPSFRRERSGEGRIVTKKELQFLLGWHQNTMEGWLNRGAPVRQRGGTRQDYQIATAEFIQFVFREIEDVTKRLYADADLVGEEDSTLRRLHPEDPRFRKEFLHADKLELELSKEYKDVISIRDAMVILAEQFGVVKSRLSALPGRVMMQLSKMDKPREIEKLLKDEIFQTLESLNLEDVSKADDPLALGKGDAEDDDEKL